MWILVNILIVSCSLIFIPKSVLDIFWIPKEMVFNLLGFSIISSAWIKAGNKRFAYKNLWAGILLIYTIVGFCWFYYYPIMMSDGEIFINYWTTRPTINIILGLFLIQTLVENTDSLGRWINISKALCWTSLGVSIFAILQYMGLDQVFGASVDAGAMNFTNGHINRPELMQTFMGHKFLTATFLAMIAPLCLMFDHWKYKVIYGLSFIVICLADVTTAFIAFILSGLCYLLLRKKFIYALVLIFISSMAIGFMRWQYETFFSGSGRFDLWGEIIKDVVNSRLVFLGSGMGSFPAHYSIGKLKAVSAHNEFIQFFKSGGIGLLIICFGYLINLFIRVISYLKRNDSILMICYCCAFIGSLVVCFNGFPLRFAPQAVIILLVSSLETQLQGEGYI